MTAIEALEALKRVAAMDGGRDNERAHIEADNILLAFLENHDPACADIAKAWKEAEERIGFWYA